MDEKFSSLKEKLVTKVGKSFEHDHTEKIMPPNKETSPDTQRYFFCSQATL